MTEVSSVITTLVTLGCRSRFIANAAQHIRITHPTTAPQPMRQRFTTRRRLFQLSLKSGWLVSVRTNWWAVSGILGYLHPSQGYATAKYRRTLGLALKMTESPNGSTTPLIDSNGDQWTLVAGQVLKNGSPAGYSANVPLLLYWNHVIYQQNNAGDWWN